MEDDCHFVEWFFQQVFLNAKLQIPNTASGFISWNYLSKLSHFAYPDCQHFVEDTGSARYTFHPVRGLNLDHRSIPVCIKLHMDDQAGAHTVAHSRSRNYCSVRCDHMFVNICIHQWRHDSAQTSALGSHHSSLRDMWRPERANIWHWYRGLAGN